MRLRTTAPIATPIARLAVRDRAKRFEERGTVLGGARGCRDRVPVDGGGHIDRREGERPDHRKPHQQAAEEQPPARALEAALKVAVVGVAHLEAFEPGHRERIGEAEGEHDHDPPEAPAHRIAQGRAVLMAAHAAVDGAGEPVAPGAIDGELAEEEQDRKAQRTGELPDRAKPQRCHEQHQVERHQHGDGDQEADQQLGGGAGILQGFAGDFGAGPQEAPHVGGKPEPVDAERDREQRRAADQQPPIGVLIADETRGGRGRRRGRGREAGRHRRRRCSHINDSHARAPQSISTSGFIPDIRAPAYTPNPPVWSFRPRPGFTPPRWAAGSP